MKKWILLIAAVTVAGAASAATVDADIGIYSKYIWRGMQLDENPVVQGGVTVSHDAGFYANVWGNYSLEDDYIGVEGLNEVDYTVGYGGSLGAVDYDLGYIYYSFPNTGWDSTSEIYAGLALNNMVITPSLYVYYDVDEANGFYAVADLNYSTNVTEELSVEVGASMAWASSNFNNFYYGDDSSMLSDASVYAGLGFAVTESVSLSASVACSFYPDSSAADAADSAWADDVNIYGGLSLAYSF